MAGQWSLGLARQQRFGVARKAAHRTQSHVTDDPTDAESRITGKGVGQRFVTRQIGADEARQIIETAAYFPALDHFLDFQEGLFEALLMAEPLERNLGEHRNRFR